MKKYLAALFFFGFGVCFGQDSLITKTKGESRRIKKIATWDSCFIVKTKGDTIYGRVQHRQDQSSKEGGYGSDNTIFFVYPNGKKQQFIANNIRELYVIDAPAEYKRYLTLEDEYYVSSVGVLYRVIVDGPCKLVFDRAGNSSNATPFQEQRELQAVDPENKKYLSSGNTLTFYEEGHYYIYYKNNLTPIRVDVMADPLGVLRFEASAMFKKKCRKILGDCPSLVQQIENNTLVASDMREIVKQFNQCIEGAGEKK